MELESELKESGKYMYDIRSNMYLFEMSLIVENTGGFLMRSVSWSRREGRMI